MLHFVLNRDRHLSGKRGRHLDGTRRERGIEDKLQSNAEGSLNFISVFGRNNQFDSVHIHRANT